jgi:hypothetical protein
MGDIPADVSPTTTPPITSPRKCRPKYIRERAINAIHATTSAQPVRRKRNNRARPTANAVVALT